MQKITGIRTYSTCKAEFYGFLFIYLFIFLLKHLFEDK